jgi:hypothetical protein
MMRTAADLALEWCTILGQGSRPQFDQAVSDLLPGRANAVLSALEVAGHLEVDWERTGRWSVNPPVLALPEGSGGNACLVGGRTEGTFNALIELHASLRVESFTVVPGGPTHASTWFVGVRSLDQLEEAAAVVGATVTIDPAAFLMERFLDLDQILSAHRTEYVPSGFRAKQLNVHEMRYEPIDVKYANWPAGCFEQLSNGRRKYIFVDDEDERHVCDRWIATHAEIRRQRRAGRRVPEILWWDMSTERMAVLATAQLPTYWARAAALCSGLSPRRVERARWTDIYEGVRLLMYGRFCKALELQPISTDLSEYDEEQT